MKRYPSDRSERARQLHREGKFGGADYGRLGGRPRKLRVAPEGVDAAFENSDEIIAALRDGVASHQPMRTRLRAVELWLQLEADTAEEETPEAPAGAAQAMSRDALIAEITKRLQPPKAA